MFLIGNAVINLISKHSLNKKQADGVLFVINIPVLMCFLVAIGALFLILFTLRSLIFLYAVAFMPAYMVLEKASPNHYRRAKLPEIWQKCFVGITDNWYFMVKRIADCQGSLKT